MQVHVSNFLYFYYVIRLQLFPRTKTIFLMWFIEDIEDDHRGSEESVEYDEDDIANTEYDEDRG